MDKIGNNYYKYDPKAPAPERGSLDMLSKEEKMDILVPKCSDLLTKRAEREVPENGKFRRIFVAFEIPETQNETLFSIEPDAKDFKDEIQPRYVFRLDIKDKTEEEIMAGFHQKWRYNIRLAGRKGVTVKDGTKEDLKDFHRIMVETGERDGFIIRPLEYFEKMYDCLGPEHMKVLMAYYDGEPISGVIPIFYGNKTWYLYGASSNKHRNLMPN